VIGLPLRYRPRGLSPLSKRTIAYTRRRRKKSRPVEKQARSARPVNTEIVLFDHGPAEFPVAAVRPREPSARAVAAIASLQRWLAARWQWLRPRAVPCAVAGLGMVAVLAFSDYLAHYKEDCSNTHAPAPVHIDLAPR
jgi:hypothetical protein